MEDQIKQITERKVDEKEATLILAFALLEVLKSLDALGAKYEVQQKATQDFILVKRLVFGTVAIILTAVVGALITLVVVQR